MVFRRHCFFDRHFCLRPRPRFWSWAEIADLSTGSRGQKLGRVVEFRVSVPEGRKRAAGSLLVRCRWQEGSRSAHLHTLPARAFCRLPLRFKPSQNQTTGTRWPFFPGRIQKGHGNRHALRQDLTTCRRRFNRSGLTSFRKIRSPQGTPTFPLTQLMLRISHRLTDFPLSASKRHLGFLLLATG